MLAFVIASLHLLSSPAHDGSFPEAVKSGWNDWKWPVYGDKDNDGGRWSDSDRGTGSDPATPLESNTSSATEASNVPTAVAADGSKKVPDKTVPGKEGKEAATPAKAGTKTNKETPTCVAQAAWKSQPLSALNTTFEVADDIFYDPAGPRPEQIVILTASDGGGHNGGIENIVERAMENRKAYCEYQGYINHFINISKFDLDGAHPVWKKLPAIVETFNKFPDAQWVWMLDLDAIVMTPTVDLRETLLSEKGMQRGLDLGAYLHRANWKSLGLWTPSEVDFQNTDFLIAQDHNGVNAGSFFIRRSKFTQLFVDMWADPFFRKMTWPGQEQDTIVCFTLPPKSVVVGELLTVDGVL